MKRRVPSLASRGVGADIVEVEDPTPGQQRHDVAGNSALQFILGLFRHLVCPAAGTLYGHPAVETHALLSIIEEEPLVQHGTVVIRRSQLHLETTDVVVLIRGGVHLDTGSGRLAIRPLEDQSVHASAVEDLLLERVVPDAGYQLQGTDHVGFARPVGPDQDRDIRGDLPTCVP